MKLHISQLYFNDVLKYAKFVNSNIHFLHISPKEKAFLPEDTDVYRNIMKIIENNKKHVFKNIFGRKSMKFLSTPINKIREVIIAKRLEAIYTKEELLLLY